MITQDSIAQALFEGARRDTSRITGFHTCKYENIVIAKDVSLEEARTIRKNYRNLLGVKVDIFEEKTIAGDGTEIFSGNPSTFSHIPSHVPSDVPMFDIMMDGKKVATNLTDKATFDFIHEVIAQDMAQVGRGDDAIKLIMDTLTSNDLSDIYGITVIRYNPPTNDAPAPEVTPSDNWKRKRTIGKEKVHRVREVSYVGTPKELQEWSVIDVSNLQVLYSGTKETCLGYMRSRLQAGYKLHTMRVMKCNKYATYRADVLLNGYKLTHHGETVCIGTRKDVEDFVIAGLTNKYLTQDALKVVKM